MTALGRKGIFGIGAAVCLIVLVAGWFLLVAPVRSDISKTKAATVTQTTQNDALNLTLSTMRSIAKKLPQEQAELAALNQRVPNQVLLPSLLRSITDAATETGVTIASLIPTQPTPLAGAPGIAAVGISLSVSGGYAELEQFDSALEALKRTYLITGFTMTGGGSSTDPAAVNVSASFDGQVLVNTSTASK
jgi:type IV pilus assembly protein PilO